MQPNPTTSFTYNLRSSHCCQSQVNFTTLLSLPIWINFWLKAMQLILIPDLCCQEHCRAGEDSWYGREVSSCSGQ